MLVIELPMPTHSLNTLQRMHYHAVRRIRDQYTTLFRHHVTSVTRCRPHQFRHVTITRHGARDLDYDNLVGGCKPLVDAMKRAGLLWDDSPRYAMINYEQTRASAKKTKTVVRVSL